MLEKDFAVCSYSYIKALSLSPLVPAASAWAMSQEALPELFIVNVHEAIKQHF